MSNPYNAPSANLSDPANSGETYEPRVFAFGGRIGRLRYLAYSFSIVLVFAAFAGIWGALVGRFSETLAMFGLIMYVPMFVYTVAIAKRRLNDMDVTGWLAILSLIPFVNLIFGLVLIFSAGSERNNQYGPPPSKNSGWVVAGACVAPALFVIGILAAISIPAYQAYVEKARAAQGANLPRVAPNQP